MGTGPFGASPKLPASQGGYLLITVVVALFLVAAVAMLLAHDSAISANTSSAELETARAEYVAQAGMQHALWRAGNNACMGDVTIPATSLGSDQYTASITGAAAGTSYILNADQDAWIRSDETDENNGTSTANHVSQETGNVEQVLTRFDLSGLAANAQINSAVAWFHLKSGNDHPEGDITVHEIAADWSETSVTWDSFAGAYRSSVIGTIPAQDIGDVWVAFNITGLVQAWANGQPNHGILFHSDAEGLRTEYTSREDGANPPRLEVVVGSGQALPVAIQATGTLANGVSRTVDRPLTTVYQPPIVYTFRPDAAESEDTEIWDQAPNNNYRDAAETWVSSASNDTTRSLLRFNMSAIPAGARVLEATLSLSRQSGSGADQPISAHRITNSWDEDAVTWNRRETGTNWDTAGGDFENLAAATTSVGPANQPYDWDITRLAQGWIDGSYQNYGIAMIATIDGMAGERFYTSDQPDPGKRPSLAVTYICECGSPCMAPQSSGNVLMVIGNSPVNPSAAEEEIRDYLEGFGYTVTLIQDDDSQGNFNAEMAGKDVVFISETVTGANVGTKLSDATIGVVSAERNLNDELGISTGNSNPVSQTVEVIDNSHYITSMFAAGPLELKSAASELASVGGTLASGAQELAQIGGVGSLVALDTGATTSTGGSASGRRVLLPVGEGNTSWNYLTSSGRLLVQRSLDWGMGVDIVSSGNVLMVVINPGNLTSQEQAKKSLIETWGYTVNLIDESDSQTTFDTAVAANDVVFVTEDVSASNVGNKLNNATIGVVIEETNLADDLGFSGGIDWDSGTDFDIDNSHFITAPLPSGNVVLLSSFESLAYLTGTIAPGLDLLGNHDGNISIAALDNGAAMSAGGSAPGRRVFLPWGGNNMDVAYLNTDGLTVFRRALDWGAGAGESGATAPIAHWKLDETSGTIAVDSVGGNDGTLNNGPVWTPGTIDGGLDFDGSNDYLITGSNFTPPPVGTVAFWMQVSGSPGSHGRILGLDDTWEIRHVTTGTPDGIPYGLVFDLGLSGINTDFVTTTTVDTPGHWYHVAASYDTDTDAYAVYIDGTPHKSGTYPSAMSVPAANLLSVGTRTGSTNYFDGTLDDVRIYDRVLDATEIAELAASSALLPIAHWKLDDGVGTTAIDSVGGNDGTLMNGPVWVAGQLGDALSFDGSNDYIDVSSLNPRSYDDVTISAWYKSAENNVSDDEYIFEHTYNWQEEISFGPTDDGGETLRFGFTVGGSWLPHYGTSDIVDQQWHHLVAVRADGRVKLYVDNVKETDEVDNHAGVTVTIDGQGPFIGDYPGQTEQVHGIVDDVRLYDRGLTDAEVADLFALGGGGGGGGGACDGTFRDDFDAISFSGSNGTLAWAGDWLEVGESNGANSGDIRVLEDYSTYQLRITDNDNGGEGVERVADLSGATSANLSFDYRRNGLDNANDYVALYVAANGTGGPWTELARYQGAGTDSSYQSVSYDISAHISATTAIRLRSSPSNGGNDRVFFDNIEIACSP